MSNTSVFMRRQLRRMQHRDRDHQSGLIGQGHMAFADAQAVAHFGAALRIDHFRLAPGVLHDAHVADPHAVRKARAHALDDGFLGGKAHGQKAHRPRACVRAARAPPASADAERSARRAS